MMNEGRRPARVPLVEDNPGDALLTHAGLRVLLVEDNDGDALLVEEALEDVGGVTTARAATAAAAAAVLDEDVFDCVLLDLGLPDVAGELDALSRVLETAPTAAVVVLTGRDDTSLAARAVAAGAQDYLTKGRLGTADLARAVRFAAQRARTVAELRSSNDELVAFAQRVAHDLRGPLASMIGYAQLLRGDHDLDEATRAMTLDRISGVGHRMAAMVSGMLRYAETTGGDRGVVDLRDVVAWVEPLLEADLAAADGRVEVGPVVPVWANEPALRTVLLNLLTNAVKYRDEERGLVIRVWAEQVGDVAVVHVADNGRGVAVADRERVFRPGQRLDGAAAGAHGVGLGLSAVQRLVEQLDGTVSLHDTAWGDGVDVRVVLPALPRGQVDA